MFAHQLNSNHHARTHAVTVSECARDSDVPAHKYVYGEFSSYCSWCVYT